MNTGTFRPVLPAAVCLLLVTACGLPQAYQAQMQEVGTSYPEPESLDADPATTGLLLVDAVGKKALNSMDLTGVVIAPVFEPGTPIIAGTFNKGGFLSGVAGVVVFDGLAPGYYQVLRMRTRNVNMWETVPMPVSDEFMVNVVAGQPVYFGRVEIRHPMGTTRRETTINYSESREAEAWQLVLDKFGTSAWAPIIEAARPKPATGGN